MTDTAPATRLRLVRLVVQFEAFADDGTDLTPLQTQPLVVPSAQLDAFLAEGCRAALDGLRQQVEAPATEPA